MPRLGLLVALLLAAPVGAVLGGLPLPAPAARAWAPDADGNGLADGLDADLRRGAEELALLHVHYARRPTEEDAARLRALGALRTYVFLSWDEIQAEAPVAAAPALLRAPGVVGIERAEIPTADLELTSPVIRAREYTGPPLAGPTDHTLSAHGDLGLRGEGMVVAILDTGVDNLHESLDDLDDDPATADPKLLQKGLLAGGADASTGFAVVGCVDPMDDHIHGTPAAGVAVGTGGPERRFEGVAPAARMVDVDVAVKGLGTGVYAGLDWIVAFNEGATCWGDPGEDRIDVALVAFSTNWSSPYSALSVKITEVVRSGITVVASAGNSGPAYFSLRNGAEGGIVVGAMDPMETVVRWDDRYWWYSGRGPRLPDNDTDSVDELRPDVVAPGYQVIAPLPFISDAYGPLDGTSLAAAHVAGVAALVLQANPALRPVDLGSHEAMGDAGAVPVRDLLVKTAHYNSFGANPGEERSGRFGRLWNDVWGYGMVDAYAAAHSAGP